MPEAPVIKMRLALSGRPLNSYKFSQDVITVGRDQNSDINVDNPAVSRDHLRFELTPSGDYKVLDLASVNGTCLNDEKVETAIVKTGDVIRFGKYTIWIDIEPDQRKRTDDRTTTPVYDQATTMLSPEELERLMSSVRQKEQKTLGTDQRVWDNRPATKAVSKARRKVSTEVVAWTITIVLGTAIGAGAAWYFLR